MQKSVFNNRKKIRMNVNVEDTNVLTQTYSWMSINIHQNIKYFKHNFQILMVSIFYIT
jgi:hypothetical protein